jgi:mannitol-specific phosphotransferase system IIBC component
MKDVISFFDKFEDKIRVKLSRHPILYTFIGGVSIVLFWRAVWHTADILASQGGIIGFLFYEPINLVIVTMILLASGLFVSYFIGDTILMSGLKGQKKMTDKTVKELREEEASLENVQESLNELKAEVVKMKEVVQVEAAAHHPEVAEND